MNNWCQGLNPGSLHVKHVFQPFIHIPLQEHKKLGLKANIFLKNAVTDIFRDTEAILFFIGETRRGKYAKRIFGSP